MRSRKDRQDAELKLSVKPYFSKNGITIYHGDNLPRLLEIPNAIADAVITDSPYCSGGMSASSRTADPVAKYCHNGNAQGRPSFEGDARDQRSFGYWATLWLGECRRISKPSAYCLLFTDWRQLPTMTDVLQAGGFIWRGVIPWNKGGGARAPHKGFFRHQCEYVIWGTNGKVPKATHSGPYPGFITETVKQSNKHHITGKPTPLMTKLVDCVPPGGLVVDLFGGSGTTAVACAMTGRRCVVFEQSEEYCEIAAGRIERALKADLQTAA